jgi:hypothetical protein
MLADALGVVVGWVSSAELQRDAKETIAAKYVSSGTAVRLSRALSLKPGLHRSSRSEMARRGKPIIPRFPQYALLPSKVLGLFPVLGAFSCW